ncbi:MAG: hypothetical protein AAGA35_00815 [Patescibacteria group bacterium]
MAIPGWESHDVPKLFDKIVGAPELKISVLLAIVVGLFSTGFWMSYVIRMEMHPLSAITALGLAWMAALAVFYVNELLARAVYFFTFRSLPSRRLWNCLAQPV